MNDINEENDIDDNLNTKTSNYKKFIVDYFKIKTIEDNELKEISEIINKYTEINEVLILAEGMIDIDLAKFISNLKTKKIKKLNIEYCGNEAMKELCNFLEIIYI